MAHETFGGGPALNEGWDFAIDGTGDIQTVEGIDELEKDLAFRSTVALQEFLGRPIDNTMAQRMRLVLRNAFLDDDRVSEVTSIGFERTGRDEITVETTVVADDNENYEFVFPVGE